MRHRQNQGLHPIFQRQEMGVIDALGDIYLNRNQKRYRDTDKFTPIVKVQTANKIIAENVFNALTSLEIGCHVKTTENNKRNRLEWIIEVSGCKRVLKFCKSHKLKIKKNHTELLYSYICQRLDSSKTVDLEGPSCYEAIQALD